MLIAALGRSGSAAKILGAEMDIASGAALIAALAGALGVFWTIYSQVHERSGALQAQRASQNLELMERIGLGGADGDSDAQETQALHDRQVHSLKRIIRLNTAAFVVRSLKPVPSLWSIGLLLVYSVVSFALGRVSILAGEVLTSEGVGNLIVGWVLILLGTAGLFMMCVLFVRRIDRIQQHKAAGIDPKRVAKKR